MNALNYHLILVFVLRRLMSLHLPTILQEIFVAVMVSLLTNLNLAVKKEVRDI